MYTKKVSNEEAFAAGQKRAASVLEGEESTPEYLQHLRNVWVGELAEALEAGDDPIQEQYMWGHLRQLEIAEGGNT